MSVLSAATLRFDDAHEGQLGDISWFPGVAELSLFGTKTDPLLRGQAAVLPASDAPSSGFRAALESARLGLGRLLEVPADTLRAMAATFVARLQGQELGHGPQELAAWPHEIRALAAPLYAQGIPVHCLPLLGQWQYERLSAASDLGAPMELREFVRIAKAVLRDQCGTARAYIGSAESDKHVEKILGAGAPILWTPTNQYVATGSKYNAAARYTRMVPVRPPRMFQSRVSSATTAELTARLKACQAKVAELQAAGTKAERARDDVQQRLDVRAPACACAHTPRLTCGCALCRSWRSVATACSARR
jgi:hypothetical protein